ncbi:MAG: CocE/NonD family hydrolase [Bacteroidetes bacterium]|nr:CocE/NonD family hydrolase [Bacteroidota bacterium]
MKKSILFFLLFNMCMITYARIINQDSLYIVTNYYKIERKIPMRDGVKLFTSIYIPKNTSEKHPILIERTPYSCAPYGENNFYPFWSKRTKDYLVNENYIIVVQDVRGKYMSEGTFEDVRPYIPTKKTAQDVDEASDVFDAIEWLVKNIPNNNGCVGVSGISYPGFYAAMAALSYHPALKAISPQAPVADWWIGDDAHHNGAFFLLDNFDFQYYFGMPHKGNRTTAYPKFIYPTKDNYDFHLKMGSIKNLTKAYMNDSVKFWKDALNHPNYDDFWKSHSLIPHLKNIKSAVLTTGGLFDAEDCWGTWNVYKAIEKNCSNTANKIVVGPWFHGGWERSDGSKLGNVQFTQGVSDYYFKNIELPFFNFYLKNKGDISKISEATIYFTGENKWKQFSQWPPIGVTTTPMYLNEKSILSFTKPTVQLSNSKYISDPSKPVPYTEDVHLRRTKEYMCDDQRFASRRPDVLVFSTDTLTEDVTLAGPILAKLLVSISTTDADFVVKLIDVFPDNFNYSTENKYPMGGYQMLVRGEIFRGRYRNSLSTPEAFTPNKTEEVKFELPDVAHTFSKGHKIMVQIQSTWFPLADRNPQQFVDIYSCDEKDFVESTIKIFHDSNNSSCLLLPVLKNILPEK